MGLINYYITNGCNWYNHPIDVKDVNEKGHVNVNDNIDDDGDDSNDDNANDKDNDNDVDVECHQLFSCTWCQRWFIGILYI